MYVHSSFQCKKKEKRNWSHKRIWCHNFQHQVKTSWIHCTSTLSCFFVSFLFLQKYNDLIIHFTHLIGGTYVHPKLILPAAADINGRDGHQWQDYYLKHLSQSHHGDHVKFCNNSNMNWSQSCNESRAALTHRAKCLTSKISQRLD